MVSAKEDGVTGMTMLTRMMSCTGQYWAIQDCTMLHWNVLGYSGLGMWFMWSRWSMWSMWSRWSKWSRWSRWTRWSRWSEWLG